MLSLGDLWDSHKRSNLRATGVQERKAKYRRNSLKKIMTGNSSDVTSRPPDSENSANLKGYKPELIIIKLLN